MLKDKDYTHRGGITCLSPHSSWDGARNWVNLDSRLTLLVYTLDYHTEWSKSDRERQIWYHLYVESKEMIQMNLFTKQK